MYPVWWGLHDTLVPLYSTLASPGPPKMKTQISSDYCSHILHIVELWCDFEMFVGPWSIYIKCLWVLLTNVYWFRATGGYICGCGRPSNLVCICKYRYISRNKAEHYFLYLDDVDRDSLKQKLLQAYSDHSDIFCLVEPFTVSYRYINCQWVSIIYPEHVGDPPPPTHTHTQTPLVIS